MSEGAAVKERRDPIVCLCLEVREGDLRAAIRRAGLSDLASIGLCTGAGEGCTACHPDLRRILQEEAGRARRN